MSDTFGTPDRSSGPSSAQTVHEAYSFVCMHCGHGWEQSFEIEHRTDEHGHTSVVYYTGTQSVPSPLTRPSCPNCGGHLVRIMRSGRVSSARWGRPAPASYSGPSGTKDSAKAFPGPGSLFATAYDEQQDEAGADDATGDRTATGAGEAHEHGGEEDQQRHGPHWLASLLALFHHKGPQDETHHRRRAA